MPNELLKSLNAEEELAEGMKGGDARNHMTNPTDDGFFCSELVAAAYQYLGMLPDERLASSFWPSTLANENINVQLQEATNGVAKISQLVYLDKE